MYHWLPFTTAVLCPTIIWECNYFFFKSCQDTVFDFILYQSICGQCLSSPILQCQNLGERGVKSLHPFQPLSLPYHQLPASLTKPSLSKYFFLVELLWILPSLSADASALKSASGFPDTSQFSVCLWRGSMSSSSPSCSQPLSYKDVKLRKCRYPQLPCLLHLPTFCNGSGCAEKSHGDQYWEHSCTGTDAEGTEGVWCLQTLRQTGTPRRTGKQVTPFRILNLRNVWTHTESVCIYIALIPDAVPESNMKLCFGFTRKEVVGLISTCIVNLKQREQKQLFSRWKIYIQSETAIHSALRIGGGKVIIQ